MFLYQSQKIIFFQIGKKSLPEDEADELNTVIQKMGKIYGASKICLDEEEESCYNLGKFFFDRTLKKIRSL